MHGASNVSRKRDNFLIALVSLATLMAVISLLRGWVRGSLALAYVHTFYRPGLEKASDEELAEISVQLKSFGFAPIGTPNPAECDNEPNNDYRYVGLRMTIDCRKRHSFMTLIDDEFINNWKKSSQELENNLTRLYTL